MPKARVTPPDWAALVESAARLAVIAAGGTGGHLFPAQALAEVLRDRGWRIVLATDARAAGLADSFPAEERLALASATLGPGGARAAPGAAARLARGVVQARAALRRLGPAIVVGFGGYPSLPAMLAAISQGRRTVIHEQNAVSGRANRLIAARASAIGCAFPLLLKATPRNRARAVVVGNPVRPEIAGLADLSYEPPGERIRLLATGGSQGARVLSVAVPRAVAQLGEDLRRRLIVEQQVRAEQVDEATAIYAEAGVAAEVAPFFADMAGRLGRAHLAIGRAGASTVTELAVAGRPSILVPLGQALDDDQGQNAKVLADAGGARVIAEADLTPERLAAEIADLLTDPARLSRMAAGARTIARPDAAGRLADLVEATAA